MSDIPPKGYELVAWFGRDCQGCPRLGVGTPLEEAEKCMKKYARPRLVEEDDGWAVYAPFEENEVPPLVSEWLDTPLEKHIARWKLEMEQGLRDSAGKWTGGKRRWRTRDRGQTE